MIRTNKITEITLADLLKIFSFLARIRKLNASQLIKA